MQNLADRAAVLAVVDGHPYARFATSMAGGVTGVHDHEAVLWWGDGPLGRLAHGLGDPDAILSLLEMVRGNGRLAGLTRVNLPRRREIPAGYTHYEDWDYRWSERPPPPQPGQGAVTVVEDADAINGLLDEAFPDSMLRPGHPMVTAWYGIWSDGHLVACAADRSTRKAEPSVGVLGGIAVHPGQRRHGWGAAVTAGLTEVLRDRHPLVALGVVAGNDPATRLYVRLGFTGVHEVTAIKPS